MSQASPLVTDLAKHVRARILAGEFAAESRVTESGLAAEYGVARPTVRSAIDLLVADGLLLRSPFAALRVPTLPLSELPEILSILDFTETEALRRIIASNPDLRELRRSASSSVHNFLDAIVRSSGSPRLEWIHRRTTFELILLARQHPAECAEPDDAAALPPMGRLADALVTERGDEALALLAELQAGRRARAGSTASAPADAALG